MQNILLLTLLIPIIITPLIYFLEWKKPGASAFLLAFACVVDIILIFKILPLILANPDHVYIESYYWIPTFHASFMLFMDGISFSMAVTTLILILASSLFSINYMQNREGLVNYYALLTLLSIGLLGVFITSNLMLFYFFWELMLIPAYFIIGEWGYRESYKAAFKFFIFTHAGAVFILLAIGTIFMVTGSLDFSQVKASLTSVDPEIVKWILLSFTAGFAVKMAVFPVHMWLPDAHSEAPAPMSALLSGVIIGAGAYAIFRISLETILSTVTLTGFGSRFLHGLTIFAILSAFFGSLIALVENDIKRIIAYSSIAHMGYVLFGFSLFPALEALTGALLHLVTHALSKGLFFLSAGAVMKRLEIRDIRKMGGLAGQMPFTATSATTAALSIAGFPPFACFFSEFLMFVGAFKAIREDSFYLIPTILMLIAAVLSLAYALRFLSHVFLGPPPRHEKISEVEFFMKMAMALLMVFIVLLGVWPTFIIELVESSLAT